MVRVSSSCMRVVPAPMCARAPPLLALPRLVDALAFLKDLAVGHSFRENSGGSPPLLVFFCPEVEEVSLSPFSTAVNFELNSLFT